MLPILMLVAVMSSECLVVDGEKILASHLAAHIPSIGGIHEDTSFGFTPKAGVRRIIPGFEVAAFAARHGVTISSDEEICVIRPSRKLTDEEVQQSLIRVVR